MDDIVTRLVRIETKQDMLLERDSDHEERLRWLEKEQWLHRGVATVIAFLLARVSWINWSH